jgi:retinol dehydrogenase-14
LMRPVMKSPEQGAQTSVYAATSPELEGVSGRLFINSRPGRTSATADDRALAERLWTVSAQLVGLA